MRRVDGTSFVLEQRANSSGRSDRSTGRPRAPISGNIMSSGGGEAFPRRNIAGTLFVELQRHLQHRVAEAEVAEEALGGFVGGGGPEDDARGAVFAEPVDGGGEQLPGDAGASRVFAHGDVVDEAGRAAK